MTRDAISDGRGDHNGPNKRLYFERWKHRVRVDDWLYYLDDGLIRIDYTPSCPLEVSISPLLGVLDKEARHSESDRLLALRSEQVRDLLRENIGFRIKAGVSALSA